MIFPYTPIHLWGEYFYEIYSTEVAEKKLVLYFSFVQQLLVSQNSSDLYSKLFMHVAGTDCAVF